jgi:hypothetical protein
MRETGSQRLAKTPPKSKARAKKRPAGSSNRGGNRSGGKNPDSAAA